MKKYWKVFGIVAIVAGIIYYPTLKLYHFIAKQMAEKDDDGDVVRFKVFNPMFRSKYKPHHPNAHNGDSNANLA